MKISIIKDAIDNHHSSMSNELYAKVWEPVAEITETTSYKDMSLRYLETTGLYTGWLARVVMLKVIDFLAWEPAPVEYLKEFWKTAENALDDAGNARDITTVELFDLYIDFYCTEPSAELMIEFHFQDLRKAIYRELGGEEGIKELEDIRKNAGSLDFDTFSTFYLLKSITNRANSQPQTTHEYLKQTLLTSHEVTPDAGATPDSPSFKRLFPAAESSYQQSFGHAIQISDGHEVDSTYSLLGQNNR
jgi:hypothetical protein